MKSKNSLVEQNEKFINFKKSDRIGEFTPIFLAYWTTSEFHIEAKNIVTKWVYGF